MVNNPVPVKNEPEKLNINDMLGIKKEVKKNDFSDLLGDVGVANTKNKKKNNDFFNDLDFWYFYYCYHFYHIATNVFMFLGLFLWVITHKAINII